jgi:hypothetical protein
MMMGLRDQRFHIGIEILDSHRDYIQGRTDHSKPFLNLEIARYVQ